MNPLLLLGAGVLGFLWWQSTQKEKEKGPTAPVPPNPGPAGPFPPVEPPTVPVNPPIVPGPFTKPGIEAEAPPTIVFPDLPPVVIAPPKPPAKPVVAVSKADALIPLLPPFTADVAGLSAQAAISDYRRSAIVSLLQNTWNEPLYTGELDPSTVGEALYRAGWKNDPPRSPIIVQIWGIYDTVVGDAMRDKSVVDSYRKGSIPKSELKKIMVSSPGNIVGTSERRFKAATGG